MQTDSERRPAGPPPLWSVATWRAAIWQGLILCALWGVYTLGRALAGRRITGAFSNSTDVWDAERWLHLPNEARVQAWAMGWEEGIRAAGLYYKYVHITDFVIISAWILLRHPEIFRWFRAVIVCMTGLEMVMHFVYPLAPPRMRPDLGMVDTAQIFGHSVYGNTYENHGLFNQYAAMPSMHVAWSFFFALVIIAMVRSPWRWLILLHPVLMTWTVVVTGNHYWLDGIVGVALLAAALVLFRGQAPWNAGRQAR